MFDNLSQRLDKAWDLVRKDGKLTSENIKEPMREIRRALLEADVRAAPKIPHPAALISIMSMMCVSISEPGEHDEEKPPCLKSTSLVGWP